MRLIDADALKEKINKQYKDTLGGALSAEFCCMVDKMPTVADSENKISKRLQELKEEIKTFYQAPLGDELYFICRLATDREKDCDIALIRNEKYKYFMSKTGIIRKCEIRLLPTTLDNADDYIMEFYPDEYGRVHEIIENERKKNGKNRSISHENLN